MVKISLKFLSLIAAASLASGQHIRSCKADKTIALTVSKIYKNKFLKEYILFFIIIIYI